MPLAQTSSSAPRGARHAARTRYGFLAAVGVAAVSLAVLFGATATPTTRPVAVMCPLTAPVHVSPPTGCHHGPLT